MSLQSCDHVHMYERLRAVGFFNWNRSPLYCNVNEVRCLGSIRVDFINMPKTVK
jgi:hypothetical protein